MPSFALVEKSVPIIVRIVTIFFIGLMYFAVINLNN